MIHEHLFLESRNIWEQGNFEGSVPWILKAMNQKCWESANINIVFSEHFTFISLLEYICSCFVGCCYKIQQRTIKGMREAEFGNRHLLNGIVSKSCSNLQSFWEGSQCQSGRPVRKYKLYEIRNLVFSTNEKWFPPPASPSHLFKIFETNSKP